MSTSGSAVGVTRGIALPGSARGQATERARRRAWTVLGLAFLIWCGVVSAALLMVVSHRRLATGAPTASLRVVRGAVFYQRPTSIRQIRARGRVRVEAGSIVEVSDSGRALLRFFDGTALALLPGSHVEVTSQYPGRSDAKLTSLALNLRAGTSRIDVAGTLPSGRDVRITTPNGVVSLGQGSYLVWVQDGRVGVVSYAGRAIVDDPGSEIRLRGGQRVVLSADGPPLGPFPAVDNLVRNSDLGRQLRGWTMLDRGEPGRHDVGGNRRLVEETITGRKVQALQIVRDSPNDTWNETGIVQAIDRDVSAYRTVAITGWVKVNYASLSGGGYLGSEYPMMFRINYLDERGGRPGWTRGFYYANPENRPTTNGELIATGEWYPFLARLSDLPQRPSFIESIEVLSAGHDFDAEVADVHLTVE